MGLKELHDELLLIKPEGASHEVCPVCETAPEGSSMHEREGEGGAMSETNPDETVVEPDPEIVKVPDVKPEPEPEPEVKPEVKEEAGDDFASQLSELRGIVQGLQARLDAAVLEAEQAKKDRDQLISNTAAEEAARLAKEELARVREERLAKVSEVASFPEEYLNDNADRWADMSEEDFASCLTDWAAISSKRTDEGALPRTTAMKASRDADNSKSVSTMREVMNLTLRGVDPRTL